MAAALVSAVAAAPAGAATPLPGALGGSFQRDCVQSTFDATTQRFTVATRIHLWLTTDDSDRPTTYDVSGPAPGSPMSGGTWSWDGKVHFTSGPLQGGPVAGGELTTVGYYAYPARMPHDPVKGRVADLVLRQTLPGSASTAPAVDGQEGAGPDQASYWYCGSPGFVPADRISKATREAIKRRTGLTVRLPTWLTPFETNADAAPHRPKIETMRGFIAKASRGTYSIELKCRRFYCGGGWFNAKRAPASELGHRRRVVLAGGVIGYVGSAGCAFGGDWGPSVCGRNVVVWHTRGINYAIQIYGSTDADLVRLANDTIRNG